MENWLGRPLGTVSRVVMLSAHKALSQPGVNVLHAGSSRLHVNSSQIKASCPSPRSGQLETHHLNLPFRDSCSSFVVAKVPIGDSCKPRLRAEYRPAAIGDDPALPVEMPPQAATLVPCMAGTEAEGPQQGDGQCPENRNNNAVQNRSPGSSG